MTLRTGKGGRYRYYACSIKARQGETGCKGRSSTPMEKLDSLVAEHLADRLLQPERLGEILASSATAVRSAQNADASTLPR